MLSNISSQNNISKLNFGKKFSIPEETATEIMESAWKMVPSGSKPDCWETQGLDAHRLIIATGQRDALATRLDDIKRLGLDVIDLFLGKGQKAAAIIETRISNGAEMIDDVSIATRKIAHALIHNH